MPLPLPSKSSPPSHRACLRSRKLRVTRVDEDDDDEGGKSGSDGDIGMMADKLSSRLPDSRRSPSHAFHSSGPSSSSSSCFFRAVLVFLCLYFALASSTAAIDDEAVGDSDHRSHAEWWRDDARIKRNARAQTMNGSFNPHPEVRFGREPLAEGY